MDIGFAFTVIIVCVALAVIFEIVEDYLIN